MPPSLLHGCRVVFASVVVLWASNGYVNAQSVSPQIDPSRVEEQIPQELENPSRAPRFEIPAIQGLPKEGDVAKDQTGVSFQVDRIVVRNSAVFDDKTLNGLVGEAVGNYTTLADLRQAAVNVTNFYREQGYPFSRAIVPRQTLEDNTVYIDVIEGYVGDIEYRGIKVSETSSIADYANTLKRKRPVRQDDLERYTLFINDLYGISAKVILSLIEGEPGAVRLIFLLDEKKHEAGLYLNSRGSKALGPIQATAYYSLNNLLGYNEQTNLIHLTTPGSSELRYFSLGQSWPIGPYGTRISYNLRRTDSNPGKAASVFDIESQSNAAEISLFHPWIRSREQNLSTTLSYDTRNSATESFDATIIDDHLRYVRAGFNYSLIHHQGMTQLDATFSKGLDVMDATPDGDLQASRLGASSTASKIQANIKRQQALFEDATLTLRAAGQWAFEPMFSAELFGLGGSDFGRAFDFSSVTGDSGYAASAEISYKVPVPYKDVNNVSVFAFVDGGSAYDDRDVTGDNWKGLSSTGVGVDVATHSIFNARLEFAKPLKIDADVDDEGINVYGTTSLRFAF